MAKNAKVLDRDDLERPGDRIITGKGTNTCLWHFMDFESYGVIDWYRADQLAVLEESGAVQ